MTDISQSLATRAGVLRLLAHVLRDGRMLGDGASGLDGAAAARALRLAGLTLRHMGRADALLAGRMQRQPATRVRDILRLALTEVFEDGAAPHGVVNDAVALARMSPRTAKQAGLVNAVLRGLVDDRAAWDALPPPSLPPWLRKPLAKAWTRPRLEAIEAAHLRGAPLDLTPKPGVTVDGAEVLPTGTLRLPGGQVSALPGYSEGDWWVQDAAAALPVRLLGEVRGLRVLDLCAAPGGKTMQLAAAGAKVTALDVSARRLERVAQNLARTGLEAEIVEADALDWAPDAAFDAVLLDAPCTATGTIRRHPDLPHLRDARDVEALTALQYRLIDRALTFARPGAPVVFCTCSLLPVEGEHQVTAALGRHPGLTAEAPEPADFGLPPLAVSPHGLRLLPDLWAERGGIDGFYMAVLRTPA
ncbi:RsmB/NOP family class I SAM-dependent RNA methyltransferase [Jannaschia rubra]|uniref:Ribosomal RNA small subunit methyltransferase B n=1 Tax=Jannaschia rubra TaxID=282197 RepID=A0A0M6XKG1_9RHOB|nr:RsmB/NOP family class I SAM-dependent RNA methyltransferase [Jannaschia rubra]CTQ31589.1 Ribosomal RNA small subunit methyltransferase B [Jannaschia rubra]SFF76742.1 16S rRNA (cytosine967-C5)-methyltransferase [Jannaschia rubra]